TFSIQSLFTFPPPADRRRPKRLERDVRSARTGPIPCHRSPHAEREDYDGDSPQRGFSTESVSTLCRGAWQSSDPLRNTSIGIIPWLSRDAPAAVDSLVRQGVVGDGRQCMNASRTGLAR